MAKLAGKPVTPPEKLTIYDHPQADTPAQVDHHHLLLQFGDAELLFSQCDQTRVVIDISKQASFVGNVLCQAAFSSFKVGIVDTFCQNKKAKHTDTDACNFIF